MESITNWWAEKFVFLANFQGPK